MYYLGIDAHKRDSQIAVLDREGEIVAEQRIENDQFDEIAEAYAGSKAAMEATGNYYTLDEHLDVQVAVPRQTKAIGTAEVNNDRLDAKLLAQLCRADMIAESYVPAEEIRELRSLAGARSGWRRSGPSSRTRSVPSSINRASPTTGTRSAKRVRSASSTRKLSTYRGWPDA